MLAPGQREAAEPAARLEQRHLRPGQTAFRQGGTPDGAWIVRGGRLELSAGTGRDRVVVGVLESCGMARDVPLILKQPAACTARALTDVQAGSLPTAGFFAVLDTSPELARAWLTGLARRQLRSQQALAQTVGGRAESRTAWLHDGLVRVGYRRIDLLAPDQLRRRAQGSGRPLADPARHTESGAVLPAGRSRHPQHSLRPVPRDAP